MTDNHWDATNIHYGSGTLWVSERLPDWKVPETGSHLGGNGFWQDAPATRSGQEPPPRIVASPEAYEP
jgi:hypothetical protein